MVHGSGPSSSHGMDKEKNSQEEFTYLEIIVFDRVSFLPTSVEVHLTVWYTRRTSCISG